MRPQQPTPPPQPVNTPTTTTTTTDPLMKTTPTTIPPTIPPTTTSRNIPEENPDVQSAGIPSPYTPSGDGSVSESTGSGNNPQTTVPPTDGSNPEVDKATPTQEDNGNGLNLYLSFLVYQK